MTRTGHIIGAVVCAVAGLGAGWALHGGDHTPDATEPPAKSDRRAGKSTRPAAPAGVAARIGKLSRLKDTGHRMKSAYAMAMAVPLDRIQEWLNGDYFDTPDSRVDNFFHQILYDRWLDADPEAFLSHCLHKNYDSVVTDRYMKEWARRDPGAAREFIMTLTDMRDLNEVAGIVLGEMAKTSPEESIALIGELLKNPSVGDYQFHAAIRTLVKNDPEGMLARSVDWPRSAGEHVLRQVTAVKLSQDFMGAVGWMQDYRGARGQQLLNEAMSGNRNLARDFFSFADQLPEGWAQGVIAQEAWSLARANPEACLAMDPERLGLKPQGLNDLRSQALQQIADKDWDKAAGMLNSGPGLSDDERKRLAGHLASELASKNLEAARSWAAGLADSDLRTAAENHLAERASAGTNASSNPTPRTIVADALKPQSGSSLYQVRYWSRREAAEAVDAFLELGTADRATAAKSLLRNSHYLPYDLQATLVKHQVEAKSPPGEDSPDPFAHSSSHVSGLVNQWAAWEPAAAARWVETLPPGPERQSASKLLLDSWRLQAPAEAERWLNRLPDDEGWNTVRGKEPDEQP